MRCARRAWVFLCVALAAVPIGVAAQRDDGDIERLAKALEVQEGATVAEIGAGSGSLTVLMARLVGPDGRVYSNEIDDGRRSGIEKAAAAANLGNVTVVESGARDANLPAGCCDAIFMRNVYHHFTEPAPMLASLYRALKPGGRLAVIDFAPGNGKEAERPAERDVDGTHGVSAATIEHELRQEGFEVLQTEDHTGDRRFMVVAARADSGAVTR